jgi:hypothetical protein
LPVRGGILADEVGMGKTVVTICLVLQNPSTCKRMTDAAWAQMEAFDGKRNQYPEFVSKKGLYQVYDVENRLCKALTGQDRYMIPREQWKGDPSFRFGFHSKKFHNRYGKLTCLGALRNSRLWKERADFHAPYRNALEQEAGKILRTDLYKVKTTVYTTTVTLIGQTYDEIRKFAPNLVVRVMHGSFSGHVAYFDRKKLAHRMALRDTDILLSAASTKFPDFLRLLSFHRCVADEIHKFGFHPDIRAGRMWGLTATPLANLKRSLDLIGNPSGLRTQWAAQQRSDTINPTTINALKRVIIRHTKTQVIAGATALKLPPMPVSTLKVKLSVGERHVYAAVRREWDYKISRFRSSLTGCWPIFARRPTRRPSFWLSLEIFAACCQRPRTPKS